GFWRDAQTDRRSLFSSRFCNDVNDVVVDYDRGNDDIGTEFTLSFREEAHVNQHSSLHALDSLGRNLLGELANHKQRVAEAFAVGPAIRVVHIFVSERSVRLNATGKIGVTARHENNVRSEERRVGKEINYGEVRIRMSK